MGSFSTAGAVGVTRHTELLDKEVNGVIDHADGSVTTAKLATLDHATLAPRTSNPALVAGRIWYRSDLGLLSYSPDGTTVRMIPYGTINVDAHASRHLSGGADAITGWISPSEVGPRSDSASAVEFRTRDIAGTDLVDHAFRPTDDMFGLLGTDDYRWYISFSHYTHSWGVRFRGAGMHYFPYDSAIDAYLIPMSDGRSYIGIGANRIYLVRAIYVVTGDLGFGFEDKVCPVCGREFKVGDAVALKVYKVDEDGFKCVPVHGDCNPHPLDEELIKEHEEALKPRSDPSELRYKMPNPSIGFEIVWVKPINEEYMYVQANFEDGVQVCPIVRIDAAEEEVVSAIKEAYLKEKERLVKEREAEERGRARMRRSWVGYRGRVSIERGRQL
ncbi:MAG: hypothetical protein QW407_05410 [Thermofilaceae archaeon]